MAAVRNALLSGVVVALSLAWGVQPLVAGVLAEAGSRGEATLSPARQDRSPSEVELTLEVSDASAQLIQARAKVLAEDGRAYPQGLYPDILNHAGLRGYFYVNGRATIEVPAGLTRVTLSRGFEYAPVTIYVDLERDSTVHVTLPRFAALGARGWYGGDLHSHSRHEPLDYQPTPAQVKMVAAAEGLSVLNVLDNGWQFTGAPSAVSDSTTVLYYSYEYRNETCGHVSFPGLRSPVGDYCCAMPDPPYPMILDLSAQVHAQGGARAVLAHPYTTDSYNQLTNWPGSGLGRELPVLAALGGIDALDVASYSNDPDVDTAEWFDLLSSGLSVPPSAGTDAVLNRYGDAPPGGWRVYTRTPNAGALDYDSWLAALAGGHCFVTSFPLIPEFSVGGSDMGDALEVAGDSLIAPVHIDAACAIGLQAVTLVADGQEVWSRTFATAPATCTFDTTFQLRLARPGWVLLRVDGPPPAHPALAAPQTVAYTNAVRILHDGAPARRPAAMARWLDKLDLFEPLVGPGLDWTAPWQRDTVLARLRRARQYYAQPFLNSPADFTLQLPVPGSPSASELSWQAAADPDTLDRVTYTVRFAEDSTMTDSWTEQLTATGLSEFSVPLEHWYWWSVDATDRAGNVVHSTPPCARVYLTGGVAGVPVQQRTESPRAMPNPSRGDVWLKGMGLDVAIYDMAGRRVAERGHGIVDAAGTPVWDGSRDGRPAPPGVYLARGGHSRHLVRIIRLR
jgi:hypothetical protein